MTVKDFQKEKQTVKLLKEIEWYLKMIKQDIKGVLNSSVFDKNNMYLQDDVEDIDMLRSMITCICDMEADMKCLLDKFKRFHGKETYEEEFYTLYDSLEENEDE